MTLGQMIDALKLLDRNLLIPLSFPHSFRDSYDCLAFAPDKGGMTVERLLDIAEHCVGNRFEGWKGGLYTMDLDTDVYIAPIGSTGEPLTHSFFEVQELKAALANEREWTKALAQDSKTQCEQLDKVSEALGFKDRTDKTDVWSPIKALRASETELLELLKEVNRVIVWSDTFHQWTVPGRFTMQPLLERIRKVISNES